ncbi:MAG: hypothetical protein GX259_06855 [Bacteroidales bacterium]|nr:hypothetical protein [Bacteroidales bacterium]
MKTTTFLLGIVLAFFMVSCGPTTDDAIKHNDKIVLDQKEIIDAQNLFLTSMIDAKDSESVSQAFENYLEILTEKEKKYTEIGKFDEKDSFRIAMQTYIDQMISITENEYKNLVEIYNKDIEDVSQSDRDNWEKIAKDATGKESQANDAFLEAQKRFAKEYHFELKE